MHTPNLGLGSNPIRIVLLMLKSGLFMTGRLDDRL